MISHRCPLATQMILHDIYTKNDNVDQLIRTIEEISIQLFKWLKDNKVKINSDKCHLS